MMARTTTGLLPSAWMGRGIRRQKASIRYKPVERQVSEMDNTVHQRTNTINIGTRGRIVERTQEAGGIIDAKREARITLKNLKQKGKSITEYWNEFRPVASETKLDDGTAGKWLLGGIYSELQYV